MSDNIQQWFQNHAKDYQTVLGRLERTRSVLLDGSIHEAADILEKSYMFAVLSIRTDRDRHERAFTAFYTNGGDTSVAGETDGETVRTAEDAALETVYGGNKMNWLRSTFDSTDFRMLARAVRSHADAERWDVLLDTVVENLTGVAHRKGAFMLAMAGLHEFGCIDSNVARYADLEEEGDALSFSSAEEYMNVCDDVFASVPSEVDDSEESSAESPSGDGDELPPLVKQWAIYDFERGEHARHNAFYAELPIRSDG